MCEYLTKDTQMRVFTTAERDDQGSKVADFFRRHDDMFHVRFSRNIFKDYLTNDYFYVIFILFIVFNY